MHRRNALNCLFYLACITFTPLAHSQIIPQPVNDSTRPGEFILPHTPTLSAPSADSEFFRNTLIDAGISVAPHVNGSAATFQFLSGNLLQDSKAIPTGEAHVIRITPESIQILASTPTGHYYGLQSVIQLIEDARRTHSHSIRFHCREISDSPRFHWRGFMLDESRHFTGTAGVKRLLSAMARYKLNRFHWHLTDSAAWRIEIKKYPELTRIGSRGSETDRRPDAPAQFYTQEQIRGIVAYAKRRGITIIPEIDMPGHADAAVKAYPEHDGGGYRSKNDPNKWPHFTFNPAKMATLQFLDDILAEVAALFPEAEVIHFGGDEVHFGWHNWPKLPEVQALMKKENLADLAAVETWFNRRMASSINQLGFKTGGWDEITARHLDPEKTMIWWWRHDQPEVLKQALAASYPVILTPRLPCYFDFVQHETHQFGRRWNGFNPLDHTYQFPAGLQLSASDEAKVLGIQACLWTEATPTQERRDFMTWPRLIALAEAAWTPESKKDFVSFQSRLEPQLPWLKAHGFDYYDPFKNSLEVVNAPIKQSYLDAPEPTK
jgi:hexosaminidase